MSDLKKRTKNEVTTCWLCGLPKDRCMCNEVKFEPEKRLLGIRWTRGELGFEWRFIEWLQWLKVNVETNDIFMRGIDQLPKIRGSAVVVDKPMSGCLDKLIPDLKKYRGKILACDRAAQKLLENGITPFIVGNVDSSGLCSTFYDNPIVQEHCKNIFGVFSVTAHPLVVRHWHGPRMFFCPDSRDIISSCMEYHTEVPIMAAGGCIHNTLYNLAFYLEANPIGLVGIENSCSELRFSEYPRAKHKEIENRHGRFFVDPTYEYYDKVLKKMAEEAEIWHKVKTYNCTGSGITYSNYIREKSLREFVRENPK